jgi:TPR repeat protein
VYNNANVLEDKQMNENDDNATMDLSSGIAAFETKSFTQAKMFLAPLAEQGNEEAQYRMAIMAQNGLGMVENPLMAYKYMRAAAEAGLGLAKHGLGFMYLEGECVDQDTGKAIEWFKKAAEEDELIGSMTTLGMIYFEGRGVDKDEELGRQWYRKAGFDEF